LTGGFKGPAKITERGQNPGKKARKGDFVTRRIRMTHQSLAEETRGPLKDRSDLREGHTEYKLCTL